MIDMSAPLGDLCGPVHRPKDRPLNPDLWQQPMSPPQQVRGRSGRNRASVDGSSQFERQVISADVNGNGENEIRQD